MVLVWNMAVPARGSYAPNGIGFPVTTQVAVTVADGVMFAVEVAASATLDISAATPSNERIFFLYIFIVLSCRLRRVSKKPTREATLQLSSGYGSV
jgi:hypothetical protein